MSNKKYRLLKDVLNYSTGHIIPAGHIFEHQGGSIYKSKDGWIMSSGAIEAEGWFEEVKEGRTEVTDIEPMYKWSTNYGGSGHVYELKTSKEISKEKFPLIKEAIEQVINNEVGLLGITVLSPHQLKYSQSEVDKLMEDAFNAGRELATPYFGSGFFYKNFNAYKNHKS